MGVLKVSNDIYSADFTRSLPPPLANDPDMKALATVIAEQMQTTANEIKLNIIYARIDELDEQTLDILAYDLHVDWYDYDYPIDVKRATIKDSVKVHRKLGTKYAVETALGNVFPGSKIQEWFEYGGDPYMFKVIIGVTATGVSADKQAAVLERVKFYKNLRSHLEAISYKIEKEATVQVAAVHSFGRRLEIYPYIAHGLESSGAVIYGGFTQYARTLAVYPNSEQEV
jgi:phage tail P2-like protein